RDDRHFQRGERKRECDRCCTKMGHPAASALRHNGIMKNALAIVALTSGLSIAARAESPPAVPEGLLACAKLQDSAERVRCYDAQVAAMQQAGKGAAAAAPAPTAARAPAPVPVPPNPASTAAPVNAATPAARTAETNAGSAAPRSAQSAPEPAPAGSPSAR